MAERPKAVTVIGWFFVVGGVVGMVLALPLARWGQDLFGEYWTGPLRRLSPVVLFLWGFFFSLLGVLFGNGILKGRNWARIVALAYCVVATLIVAVFYLDNPLYWLSLMGDAVFTVIVWLFLFRGDANVFFKQAEPLPG